MKNILQAYSELYEFFDSKMAYCDARLFDNDMGEKDYKADYHRIMHSEIDDCIAELQEMKAKLKKI
jgi:hypothetical protein